MVALKWAERAKCRKFHAGPAFSLLRHASAAEHGQGFLVAHHTARIATSKSAVLQKWRSLVIYEAAVLFLATGIGHERVADSAVSDLGPLQW